MRKMRSSYAELREIAEQNDPQVAQLADDIVATLAQHFGESTEAWRGGGEVASTVMTMLHIDREAFISVNGADRRRSYEQVVSVMACAFGFLLANPMMEKFE